MAKRKLTILLGSVLALAAAAPANAALVYVKGASTTSPTVYVADDDGTNAHRLGKGAVDRVPFLPGALGVDATRSQRIGVPREVVLGSTKAKAVADIVGTEEGAGRSRVRGAVTEPALHNLRHAFELVLVVQVRGDYGAARTGHAAPVARRALVRADQGVVGDRL